ncbi:hypothetical protein NQS36_16475 [Bacillus sp. C1(2022)]|nr:MULTISPECIES: hypothetical protein [Bacillus]AKQ71782.1 phage protein [Bacillus licheniformis WX-02]MBA1159636.1 hypothetical protein [Bacillus licheniformis]MBM6846084.1 hypothetical protein [Bacillus licheniformis]MCP8974454.1 hypothetical protein [Bacillus licheniformis]MCY8531016.1 hypothetical protein [Bacillus licheniformis]
MNAARYLNIHDPELILSWTPHEYKLFLKGAQYRQIDEMELLTKNALFHRYALNKKGRVTPKKMFDADKARKMVDNEEDGWRNARSLGVNPNALKRATDALKNITLPDFNKKGG